MYIVDGHCDTATKLQPQQYAVSNGASMVDFAALRQTGVGVQFWAIWQDSKEDPGFCYQRVVDILQASRVQTEACPGMGILTDQKQLEQTSSFLFMGLEGGEQLGGSLERLAQVYTLGARFLGLTWNYENELAWGCMEARDEGLKPLGREFIRWMEKKGMLLDLAHSSQKTFWDCVDFIDRPFIVSHGCCRSLHEHPRNLTDRQLKEVAAAGGVVGITAVAQFLSDGPGSVDLMVKHICHAAEVMGPRYVGIGTDFDGTEPILGLERGTKDLTVLPQKLAQAGFDRLEIEGIMGENFRRFLVNFLS